MRSWTVVAAVAVGACFSPSDITHPMQIEEVTVTVADARPPQVNARVRGIIPDGCSELAAIDQDREGNTITLSITVRRTSDGPCIQRIEIFERDLRLEGAFPPGRYVLRVNDVVRDFDI